MTHPRNVLDADGGPDTVDEPHSLGLPPPLNLQHVRWRVDSKPACRDGQYTARFVPYVTMERLAGLLDVWVGPARWWAEFEPSGTVMWCRITILTGAGDAVTKIDAGDLDGTNVKAAVSDSFKRCASRMWGVGREVRSIPTLWAPCRTYESRGELVAVANNHTIPTLRRKLADLGHAGAGDDVDGSEQLDPDSTGEAQAAPPLNPADVDAADSDVLDAALKELATKFELLDETGRGQWQAWKEDRVGWHKSIDLVHEAALMVAALLTDQTETVAS